MLDKIAFIEIKNRKLLVTLSKGKDVWYIPGGKREFGETDAEALIREVKEELDVDIIPESIKKYGVFTAQAHGKPQGTFVIMNCYIASYIGKLIPSAEIDKIDYFCYAQKNLVALAGQLIMEDLKAKKLID